MHLFKFNSETAPTVLENGEYINGWDRATWVERYRDTGEFVIESKLSKGLKAFLPLGTLISHVDTSEVMIVENHEIDENITEDPTIKISGRSFESYLENRIVGTTLARSSTTVDEYILASDYTFNQAVSLISDHISTGDDALVNVTVDADSALTTGDQVARNVNRTDLLQVLQDLLAVEDLGIKANRVDADILLFIYKGIDKSDRVIFSWKGGNISTAKYLFTQKKLKNSALVVGRYIYTVVDTGPTGYDRRIMLVSADDIDGHLSAAPTGGALTTVLNKMTTRGQQALKDQNIVNITQADVINTSNFKFRRDYDVGDLVSLEGNFGQKEVMRVTEYAEIEDENGASGHPTLAIPGE